MPGHREALESVVLHAALLGGQDDNYDDIAPALHALSACADISLVPRLHEPSTERVRELAGRVGVALGARALWLLIEWLLEWLLAAEIRN